MTGLGETIAAMNRQMQALKGGGAMEADARLLEAIGFGANPGALRMLTYKPAGLAPGAPLVVVLHGCTQSAAAYAAGAGWLTLAEHVGFAVLAPEQTRANNANLCFNWFQPEDTARDAGEVASIRQMVRHAVATHELDPTRVFVTGLSAGGAMTVALLATYPEVFAGGAAVAGLAYGVASNVQEAFAAMMAPAPPRTDSDLADRVRAASPHPGPWPTLSVWHGEADTTVRAGAGEDLARQWLQLHGLRGDGETSRAGGHTQRLWRGPDGRVRVEHHAIAGMGHGAPLKTTGPDGLGAAGPFLLEVGVSSASEIAQAWGLTGRRAEAPAPSSARARSEPAAAPQRTADARRAAKDGRHGIGAVIEKALRAAGLMK